MKPLPLLLVLVLSSCGIGKVDHYAPRPSAEEVQRAYTESLFRQCDAVGYTRDTDAHRGCVMQLHGQAQADNAQQRAMILQGIIQQQQGQQYRAMPLCATLPPGTRGYMQAAGTCR